MTMSPRTEYTTCRNQTTLTHEVSQLWGAGVAIFKVYCVVCGQLPRTCVGYHCQFRLLHRECNIPIANFKSVKRCYNLKFVHDLLENKKDLETKAICFSHFVNEVTSITGPILDDVEGQYEGLKEELAWIKRRQAEIKDRIDDARRDYEKIHKEYAFLSAQIAEYQDMELKRAIEDLGNFDDLIKD